MNLKADYIKDEMPKAAAGDWADGWSCVVKLMILTRSSKDNDEYACIAACGPASAGNAMLSPIYVSLFLVAG